jgi:hypothetical protein
MNLIVGDRVKVTNRLSHHAGEIGVIELNDGSSCLPWLVKFEGSPRDEYFDAHELELVEPELVAPAKDDVTFMVISDDGRALSFWADLEGARAEATQAAEDLGETLYVYRHVGTAKPITVTWVDA